MPSRTKLVVPTVLLLLLGSSALAAEAARPSSGSISASPVGGMADQIAALGLPRYVEPVAYRVDLAVEADGQHVVMKRFVDHGRIRTETSSGGHQSVMVELGDEKGTMYILMPDQKRAMKQSRAAIQDMAAQAAPAQVRKAREEAPAPASESSFKIEDLGEAKLGDVAVKKVRFASDQGSVLGWFDQATGAPVRLESKAGEHTSVMEWKDLKVEPQPAALFEIPKDYQVTDMDAMMAQMKSMSAGGRVGAAGGMYGGMTGGLSGMAEGRAQSFGQKMGANFGAGLGASFGGPLGAIAGQYIGGRLGGMLGKKAADTVLPGK